MDVREGRQKRRWFNDRRIRVLRECYVYVAEWLETRTREDTGAGEGQARMAAPGGPGNGPGQALAVQQGQYSHAGAIAILTREIPLEDVSRLDKLHQGIVAW